MDAHRRPSEPGRMARQSKIANRYIAPNYFLCILNLKVESILQLARKILEKFSDRARAMI